MAELRSRGLESEAAKYEQFGLPPSLALQHGSFDDYQRSRIARGQNVAQPQTQAFMAAAEAAGKPISVRDALDLMSGVMGSNVDTRNWSAIMAAPDPVAAAREATRQYYEQGAIERPFDPQQEARNLQADYESAVSTRARQLALAAAGGGGDPAGPSAYGMTPEQIEQVRRAQASGGMEGIMSLVRSQGLGMMAPGISQMFQQRQADIRRGGPEQFEMSEQRVGPFGSFADTGRMVLQDPRGRAVTVVSGERPAGEGLRMIAGDVAKLTNYGINPYTLQPMYTAGADGLTPAFDALSLGYDFGGVDPYSEAGLTNYLAYAQPQAMATPNWSGGGFGEAYLADVTRRTGLGMTPTSQPVVGGFSYVPTTGLV
jgi:hypothetical protein